MDSTRQVAIVTGSSSGVGAACVRRLAADGWNVVINYRTNEGGAADVEDDCRKLGADALVVQADVAEDGACRRLVAATEERWGRLDGLVNNAGTTKFCPPDQLEGLDEDDFFRIYGVNVVGAYQMIRAAVPVMRGSGRGAAFDGVGGSESGTGGGSGSIVNVASMAGITGVGSSTAYAASKGALITMTLSLARALGPDMRVNAICPGFIQGDWLREGLGDETYESVKSSREEASALRMTVTPEIVAESIAWFLTGSRGVTGETLMVDGGHHLSGAPLARR